MKTKKVQLFAMATAVALGAVSGTVASMNINVEQAHAKTKSVQAKENRAIYDKKGKIVFLKYIKKKQWYTADSSTKTIKANNHLLKPVRYMDKTVYIKYGQYIADL
ncbi:hypothetical protein [Rossellomorea marisflavi]|uniref:hypothetical protein n=1 Tax=Rossellomorea marisflavi TaxID=189381 RepID=UPI003F9F1BBE